tara:strand:+ start:2129 stop:3361 length:1233 start_codon:yes stop_codon:yes gene_type:complete
MEDNGFLDLSDHDSFANGVPHKTFERIRNEDPVFWTKEKNGRGFWSITKHADILKINRDNKTFSSAQGIRIEDQTEEEYLARRTFQETDPPEHRVTRMMLAPAFSQKAIANYESMVRELAHDIVKNALSTDEFDAVEKMAKQLPMMMLGRILGLPDSDLEWLVLKGDALIGNSDPEFTDHIVDKLDSDQYRFMPFRSPAALELYDYAEKILNQDININKDGVLSKVLDANSTENVMEPHEFKNFFCLLIAAGNDTTRYSIAMSLYQLSLNNTLIRDLKTNNHWDTCADEFIRLASPTMYFRRTATSDINFGGKNIKKGDKVILWFVSGNRDKDVFQNPHDPIISRSPNPHISFGQGGVHFCLGIWLARMEVRILLEELIKKIDYIKPLSEPTWTRSNFICGVKSLKVKVN